MVFTRPGVMGAHGMVASPHYLASFAGARILLEGGNAIDAAIACNAVLNVVYPHMCSPGGDLFMLIHARGATAPVALNASGRAPYAATREYFSARGMETIPLRGLLPVTVPGAVDGWAAALERYGTRSLTEVLQPAIAYAEEGFPLTEKVVRWLAENRAVLSSYPSSFRLFFPPGRTPSAGDTLRFPELGRTLRQIARQGRDVFYRGEIAQAIVRFSQENGGLLSMEDLADHQADWVDPLSTTYRGFTIYEMPPNSQGLAPLLALNIVEQYDVASLRPGTPECIHTLVEAIKLAFADRDRYVSDPAFVDIPLRELLSKDYAHKQAARINPHQATPRVPPGVPQGGDTVYLCAADQAGNVVSLIQSLYFAFGSGVVAGNTGILLQNRGAYFSLNPDHVNRLEPHKRTLHTLAPAMAYRDGRPALVFGTMGGDGQPQTHLQFLCNVIDFGMDIQEALAAPRWLYGRFVIGEQMDALNIEARVPEEVHRALERKGHKVNVLPSWAEVVGHAQAIVMDAERGIFIGAADPRSDGAAVGW